MFGHYMLHKQLRIYTVLLFLVTACKQVNKNSPNRPQPLPQDPLTQVYFNHSESSEYQENYRQHNRQGDDLEKQIVDTISQAKSTIDIAVQELRLPKIAQTLVKKQKDGVKIRLILENNYSFSWSNLTPAKIAKMTAREKGRYQEFYHFVDINQDNKLSPEEINQRDALVILLNGKVPIIDDAKDGSQGSDLMHHKFVIVDNRIVIVTSANFTLSDITGDFSNHQSLGNANNLLKIDSPEVANIFAEEFNFMWNDKKFGLQKPLRKPKTINLGDSKITIQFSPTSPTQPWIFSSNGLISQILTTATKSIDMALFVFSEQKLANILEKRSQENVNIRALVEPSFAYRYYSDALDMMGIALNNKCKYEPDNHPWQRGITTVGVPILPKGDLLHHKFAVIDGKTVITGSHNWSVAANNGNDETVLVIENPKVGAHFIKEFERLYKNARVGVPETLQNKIKAQEKNCK
jgi:phosphatidylserine/phosphatidylglycerophosphate/cardiolipin synthase-like enzyme